MSDDAIFAIKLATFTILLVVGIAGLVVQLRARKENKR